MRSFVMALGVLLLTPALVTAQQPKWELGTRLGITRLWRSGEGDTRLQIPGGGVFGEPSLHAAFFLQPKDTENPPTNFIEAEVSLVSRLSGPGGSSLGLAVMLAHLFPGAKANSAYGGLTGALLGGGGRTEIALGGALGYRIVVGSNIAVRLQGNYRRWIEREMNELSGVVILGLVTG